MAALSDHDRRDAEHALRAETSIAFQQYIRRVIDIGKAYIKEELDAAARDGRAVDGVAVGRAAAARATAAYLGAGSPQAAIEGTATRTEP